MEYKKGGNVLDVGCAYGFFLQHMSDRFKRHGIDISEHAIRQAKEGGLKGEFRICDICKKRPFSGIKFDVITMFDVIEHLRDLDSVLERVKSMLKENGYLFVFVPVSSRFHHFISALGFGLLDNDVTHINIAKTNSWMRIFGDYFEIVEDFPITLDNRYIWPLEIYHFFVLNKGPENNYHS